MKSMTFHPYLPNMLEQSITILEDIVCEGLPEAEDIQEYANEIFLESIVIGERQATFAVNYLKHHPKIETIRKGVVKLVEGGANLGTLPTILGIPKKGDDNGSKEI